MTSPAFRRHVLAHWFGCGLFPKAPGTVGSLGAIPLHMACLLLPGWLHAVVVVLVTLAGLPIAGAAARAAGEDDPAAVVIDEVAGTLIALGIVRGLGAGPALVAFVGFRFFDIVKPGVIDRSQRLGKRSLGLGIMADDVLAGLAAGSLTLALTLARRLWH